MWNWNKLVFPSILIILFSILFASAVDSQSDEEKSIASIPFIQPASAHVPGVSLTGVGTATIDGVLSPGEWDSAGSISFQANVPASEGGGTTPATLFVMNDAENLYLLVRIQRPSIYTDSIGFGFDNNHDGIREQGDDAFLLNVSPTGMGTFSATIIDDFRGPCPGDPPSSIRCGSFDTSDGGTTDGIGAVSNDVTFTFYELSHPLDSADDAHDFSLSLGDTVGFSLFVRLIVGPYPQGYGDTNFPTGNIGSASTFGDIVVAYSEVKPSTEESDPEPLPSISEEPISTEITSDSQMCKGLLSADEVKTVIGYNYELKVFSNDIDSSELDEPPFERGCNITFQELEGLTGFTMSVFVYDTDDQAKEKYEKEVGNARRLYNPMSFGSGFSLVSGGSLGSGSWSSYLEYTSVEVNDNDVGSIYLHHMDNHFLYLQTKITEGKKPLVVVDDFRDLADIVQKKIEKKPGDEKAVGGIDGPTSMILSHKDRSAVAFFTGAPEGEKPLAELSQLHEVAKIVWEKMDKKISTVSVPEEPKPPMDFFSFTELFSDLGMCEGLLSVDEVKTAIGHAGELQMIPVNLPVNNPEISIKVTMFPLNLPVNNQEMESVCMLRFIPSIFSTKSLTVMVMVFTSAEDMEKNIIEEGPMMENLDFEIIEGVSETGWKFKSVEMKEDEPAQEETGGGCLIATAAFDSELAPQVQFLREIRDHTVLSTQSGTKFMTGFNQFYYSFSPAIADLERQSPMFKETVKVAITPLLTSLSLLSYVDIDTEEEILGYGIGVILLNIGMYFVVPTIIISKLVNRNKRNLHLIRTVN